MAGSGKRIKPTEVKLVAGMLIHEAESADDLAEQIIRALDEKREKDDIYVLNYYDPNVGALVTYGPYGTGNQANKEIARLASTGPKPAQAQVTHLRRIHAG